jgi:hypothetical protein
MVPTEQSELGTEFEVERPDETGRAVVVEKPFVDPRRRPRSRSSPRARERAGVVSSASALHLDLQG